MLTRLLAPFTKVDRAHIHDSVQKRLHVIIENNRLYRHYTMCINYMTYDNRREEDIVNPRTRPDVMVLSAEAEESEDYHPYWYARIIDIFHVRV